MLTFNILNTKILSLRKTQHVIGQKLFQTYQYLLYFFFSKHKKGHGIHSPFVFDFVLNVLLKTSSHWKHDDIITLRKQLLKNNSILEYAEFGAGSVHKKKKTISGITKTAGIRNKYGRLLFRIIEYYKPVIIHELGTNIGLSTSWIASANAESNVITIEGAKKLYDVACKNIATLNLKNVVLINGDFDSVLHDSFNESSFEMVFIDGNHRYEATLRYFNWIIDRMPEKGFVIFDDIHWSKEMYRAWKTIKQDNRVKVSINLFQFGIVVKNNSLTKGNYTIRF